MSLLQRMCACSRTQLVLNVWTVVISCTLQRDHLDAVVLYIHEILNQVLKNLSFKEYICRLGVYLMTFPAAWLNHIRVTLQAVYVLYCWDEGIIIEQSFHMRMEVINGG